MIKVGDPLIRTYTKLYGTVDPGPCGGDYTTVMENYAVGNGGGADELARNINDCDAQYFLTAFLTLGVNERGSNVVRCYHRVVLFRPQMRMQTSE